MAAAHWSLIEEPSFENVMLSILGPTADMAAAAGRGANTAPPSAGRTQAAIPPPQRLGLRPVTPGTPRAPAEAVGQVAEASWLSVEVGRDHGAKNCYLST